MRKERTISHLKLWPLMGVILIVAALRFHADIDDINTWNSELIVAAEAHKVGTDQAPTPHIEDRSPAYIQALAAVNAGPRNLGNARTISWIAVCLTVGAIMLAAWGLFSEVEAITAGLVALGSVRMFAAAHTVGPDAFLFLFQSIATAFFGFALRSSNWLVWIGFLVSGVLAALSGFQASILLLAATCVGASFLFVIEQRDTRGHSKPADLPVWQYVATVPITLVLSVIWVISWLLASRSVSVPIAHPPIMHVKYFLFVHEYLWGHAAPATLLFGIAAIFGIIWSLKKRVTRIERLRRIYVDKRFRRPMIFLLLWFIIGIPALNLLQFNARRPQEPTVLAPLLIPLLLITSRGLAVIVEKLIMGIRRIFGFKVPMVIGIIIIAGGISWFGQSPGLKSYRGYRVLGEVHDYWGEAGQFFASRAPLGNGVVTSPQWAGALIRSEMNESIGDLDMITPVRGSQIDSVIQTWSSAWAIVYQSDEYPPVPSRIRQGFDQYFEPVRSFPGPEHSEIVIMATSWLHAVESQWAQEQERLAMGGDQEIQARIVLGKLYGNVGRVSYARREFEAVLAKDGFNTTALLELAALEEEQGNRSKAVEFYRRASRNDSTNAEIYFGLGRLFFTMNRYPVAARNLEKAVQIDPSHLTAIRLLSDTYKGLGRLSSADSISAVIDELGGRIILEYEFDRSLAVRSLELHTGAWSPGEEIAVELHWTCTKPIAGLFKPDFFLAGQNTKMLLAPPRGGWRLSLPDSSCDAGVSGSDSVLLKVVYTGLPDHFPDRAQLCMDLYGPAGEVLPISDLSGKRISRAYIAQIVATREAAANRVSVEVEEMDHHPGFPVPGGINITEQGVSHNFRFPGGPVRFEIVARGTPAGGQWPRMIFEMGGREIQELVVDDRSWKTYIVSLSAPPGLEPVRLRFPNDYVDSSSGEDRNLIIDRVDIVEEDIELRLEAF